MHINRVQKIHINQNKSIDKYEHDENLEKLI